MKKGAQMNRITQIVLDMDGPLVDLRKPLCELHGLPDPYTDPERIYPFDLTKVWPIPFERLWTGTDADWWADLPPQPWMEELVHELELRFGSENISLLTSPLDDDGACYTGKIRWIRKHLPQFRRRFLVGPAKEFASAPWRALIDDRPKNLDDFATGGPPGMTMPTLAFPTPWNENHKWAHDPMVVVRRWLGTYDAE